MTRSFPMAAWCCSILALVNVCPSSQGFAAGWNSILGVSSGTASLGRRCRYHPALTVSTHSLLLSSAIPIDDIVEEDEDTIPVHSSNLHNSRRSFLRTTFARYHHTLVVVTAGASSFSPEAAWAADDIDTATDTTPESKYAKLEASLYTILRVREAITQEARLIKSGKFKDAQRANVKLAIKFIVSNYRLDENFIRASAYLEGSKRYQAADTGQQCVQSLFTILEYFDSSDVQNIKVSTSGLGGKEIIVLKGLDASRSRIDEFLSYFPQEFVDVQKNKIKEENDLNFKEFDSSIGTIINPDPVTI